MILNIPELETVPADQRQALLEEAVRQTNATHGKMSPIPHYVGCALSIAIVLSLAIMNRPLLIAMLAGGTAYVASLLIGVLMWRRSQVRAVRAALSRLIAARAS